MRFSNKPDKKKSRVTIPYATKVRSELQREIHSVCPFCNNDDVGHFEIHHIDENPANNQISNLILVCPLCHSKITKGDIISQTVISVKNSLANKSFGVEFVSAVIDSKNCSWVPGAVRNSFYNSDSPKSKFPIISFTLINHTTKTLVLKTIHLRTKRLSSGIYGLPQASVLKSLVKYKVCINSNKNVVRVELLEPIQCPAGEAIKFDIELFEQDRDGTTTVPEGKIVLLFEFEFSNNIKIPIPNLHLNCQQEKESLSIYFVS